MSFSLLITVARRKYLKIEQTMNGKKKVQFPRTQEFTAQLITVPLPVCLLPVVHPAPTSSSIVTVMLPRSFAGTFGSLQGSAWLLCWVSGEHYGFKRFLFIPHRAWPRYPFTLDTSGFDRYSSLETPIRPAVSKQSQFGPCQMLVTHLKKWEWTCPPLMGVAVMRDCYSSQTWATKRFRMLRV